ncbi:MAG: site-specific integrase [Bacteroidales bacterium]|nr:site-specific integrase [Bacteroidales bacterium]
MATTFNLELKKTPTKAGTYQVYIRITKDKKHKRLVTSVALQKIAHWNPKGAKNNNWVRSQERDAAKLNDALAKELAEVRELYREDMQASVEALAAKAKNKVTSTSFLAYAIAHKNELDAQGRSIAKHYGSFCNRLEEYLKAKGLNDLSFSDLSPALLSDFESYLQKAENHKIKKEEKRLHPNYIRTLLVKFRALVNMAINEGLLSADKYPFRYYHIKKEVQTGREALSESEVNEIIALEYSKGCWLWNTKNAWLFSMYGAGIRAADLIQLRWANIKDNGNVLDYTMDKNHKKRTLILFPEAKQILLLYKSPKSKPSDYIFPFLDNKAPYAKNPDIFTLPVDLKKALFKQVYSKNTLLNKYLKQIAIDAGIKKVLSFHISRHTFATFAIAKKKTSKEVQQMLGHSHLSTTEAYLHSLNNEEINKAMKGVFSGLNTKPKKATASAKKEATNRGARKGEIDALRRRLAELLAEEGLEN